MPPAFALPIALGLLSLRAAVADCDAPTIRAEVAQAVAQAHEAFASMDRDGFQAARGHALERLACLCEELAGSDAASFHSMMALGAFLEQDDAAAVNALRAAFAANSGYTLPTALLPEGHPLLLQASVARSMAPGATTPLPEDDLITTDGQELDQRPTDRPCILQRLAFDGEVRNTAYLAIDADPPDWALPAEILPTDPVARRRRLILVGTTAAAALAAGSLYAAALLKHQGFVDPQTPYDELPGLQRRANGYAWTSAGLGVVSLGLGLGLMVTW